MQIDKLDRMCKTGLTLHQRKLISGTHVSVAVHFSASTEHSRLDGRDLDPEPLHLHAQTSRDAIERRLARIVGGVTWPRMASTAAGHHHNAP